MDYFLRKSAFLGALFSIVGSCFGAMDHPRVIGKQEIYDNIHNEYVEPYFPEYRLNSAKKLYQDSKYLVRSEAVNLNCLPIEPRNFRKINFNLEPMGEKRLDVLDLIGPFDLDRDLRDPKWAEPELEKFDGL